MSPVQKLRGFLIQRLNAAVEEIWGVFEKTIEKYEEEAALNQEVISRQHALLCALNKPIMELPPADAFTQQLSVGKGEFPPALQDQDQDQEDPHIEEEVVGVLDEADIIKFTYSSRRAGASLSAAGTEPGAEDVQVLSSASSEDETEDSDDYNQDSAESRPASSQPKAGLFSCRVCSRTFRLRRFLFRHVRAHLQEAKPVCGVCGERLEATDNLKLHLQTHLSTQKKKKKSPEPESQSRERPLHRRSRRKKNAKDHTNEKANACDDCGKTFVQVWRKRKHRCRPRRRNQGQQKKTKTS